MFENKHVLIIGGDLCVILLALSLLETLPVLRWIVGIAFVYFFSGFPLGLILLPKAKSLLERLVVSSGLSLLLTYPAGFINVLFEGQSGSAIFGRHLTGDIFWLFAIYLITSFIALRKATKLKAIKPSWHMTVLLLLIAFMTFFRIGVPDLDIDEYDLGYQAYNLVDGIFAGRKAFVLSFSSHPPLPMYIQHYTMNILDPKNFDNLSDWMFRLAPALLGTFTVLTTYALTLDITRSKRTAFAAAAILAVNNYHLFLSRIFHREIFLGFFILLCAYLLIRFKSSQKRSYLFLSAAFAGCALLVKATALTWVATGVFFLRRKSLPWLSISLLIFLPVVVYNIGAYLQTGYMDIFFANIFKTKMFAGATLVSPEPLANALSMLKILADQHSLVVLVLLALGSILGLKNFPLSRVLGLFIFLTFVFFTLTGLRVYYLAIITAPSVILATLGWRKNFIILAIIFSMSLFYSSNTLLANSSIVKEDYTSYFPPLGLRSNSLTTRKFFQDRGWKQIREKVDQVYTPKSCLSWDNKVTTLMLRRYLGIEDSIKKYYLGPNYSRDYLICNKNQKNSSLHLYYDSSGRIAL